MKMFKFKAFLATALVAVSMIAVALLLGTVDASAAGVAGVGISAASAGLPLGLPMFSPPDADTGGSADTQTTEANTETSEDEAEIGEADDDVENADITEADDDENVSDDGAIDAAMLVEAVGGDAILLLEAAWTAANSDRYRRNNYVQNLAIAYAQSERAMKDHQARLDQRDADRKQRADDAAEAMKDDGKDAA